MKISTGKYITFADSDDFYSCDFFEKIIPEIEKENFELLYFNAFYYKFNKVSHPLINEKEKVNSFICKDGLKGYMLGSFSKTIYNVPWNKIYVADIIKNNNILWEKEQKRGTDLLFNMRYTSYISSYRFVNEKLYYYVYDFNLFDAKKNSDDSITENLKYFEHVKKYCIDKNI